MVIVEVYVIVVTCRVRLLFCSRLREWFMNHAFRAKCWQMASRNSRKRPAKIKKSVTLYGFYENRRWYLKISNTKLIVNEAWEINYENNTQVKMLEHNTLSWLVSLTMTIHYSRHARARAMRLCALSFPLVFVSTLLVQALNAQFKLSIKGREN